MWISLVFHLIASMDCTFETAFQKGQADIELGSYGANIDRFCLYASEEERKNFPNYYELGRQLGPTLKKGDLSRIPKNQQELDEFLKEAKLSMAAREITERISKAPKGAVVESDEIKNLTKRIQSLEEENRRLSEKLEQVTGR